MTSPDGRVCLMLLHGLGTGPSGWQPQVDALDGTRPIAVPNLTTSYAAGWDAVIANAVQAVHEAAQEYGPVDVCGLSMGAVLALHIAATAPRDVRRVVCCAGFVRLPATLRLVQRVLSLLMRSVPASKLIGQLTAEVPTPYRERAQRELGQLSARAIAALVRATATVDIDARAILVPVLVLCGAEDSANLSLSRVLAAELPNAHLVVIRAAGHVLNLDAPADVTAAITAFLDA